MNENNQPIVPPSGTPETAPTVTPGVTPEVTPEDQPGKKSAEARIDELIGRNKELMEKVEALTTKVETKPVPTPPVTPTEKPTPDVEQAVKYVKQVGKFVSQDDLEERIKAMESRRIVDSEHQRLEAKFNGSNGGPTYTRSEMEKYMNESGIFNPEAAYEQKYKDELFDLRLKSLDKNRQTKTYTPRPNSTAGERDSHLITREKVDEIMKNPTVENKAWYNQNRKTILEMYAKGQL